MELKKAKTIAEHLKSLLELACERVAIAGSIRRRKPNVGDIELLVIPKYVASVDMLDAKIQTLIQLDVLDYRRNKVGSKVYGPKNKLLLHLESGIGVDIFSTTEETWATLLLIRTGSAENNIRLATLAKKRGWRLAANGDGLFNENGKRIAGDSEESIYKALGLRYQKPEERG